MPRTLGAPVLRASLILISFCIFAASATLAWGQQPATAPSSYVAPAPAAATNPQMPPLPETAIDTGSTAWMLTSSALVLFMVPGLALFYGGMVRAKNVLNMFLCCMVAIGVIGLQWVICGYALSFGGGSLIKGAAGSFLGWD